MRGPVPTALPAQGKPRDPILLRASLACRSPQRRVISFIAYDLEGGIRRFPGCTCRRALRDLWRKMRKSLGSKPKGLAPVLIWKITRAFSNFIEVDDRGVEKGGREMERVMLYEGILRLQPGTVSKSYPSPRSSPTTRLAIALLPPSASHARAGHCCARNQGASRRTSCRPTANCTNRITWR